MSAKTRTRSSTSGATLRSATLLLALSLGTLRTSAGELALPWSEAGLSERQAAAHLLDRFAFGARPGEVDQVVEMGLEAWLEQQLAADLPDPVVEARLEGFHTLGMSAIELKRTYPIFFRIRRQAEQAGVISSSRVPVPGSEAPSGMAAGQTAGSSRLNRAEMRKIFEFADNRGYRPLPELTDELTSQKLYRALYSENQLREVLTDFWFNHFNVSITDTDARPYVVAYERDAIRPKVLGSFEELLVATAQHPAMLEYLDNTNSVANEGTKTLERPQSGRRAMGRGGMQGFGGRGGPAAGLGRDTLGSGGMAGSGGLPNDPELRRIIEERRPRGLNENYARELMELHTLGVDGGYSQTDVIETARAFTGWTTYPEGPRGDVLKARASRLRPGEPTHGFVFGESFLFRPDAHDAEKKTILGRKYPAGHGVEEGLRVLETLSNHPSTARQIAGKLAVRFVSDQPSESLVDRLADRFIATGGDLAQMVLAVAESPEFWSSESRRSKIKSPFELAVSALRGLGAEVEHPYAVIEWVEKMGQPLYAFQAPTGYPDRADAWVNTGALLARMNFGLQLATKRIPGVHFELAALNENREPETPTGALETYLGLLVPGRDSSETRRQLASVIADPELATKIEAAAAESSPAPQSNEARMAARRNERPSPGQGGGRGGWYRRPHIAPVAPDTSTLAHVVGVILGSPEYQRR